MISAEVIKGVQELLEERGIHKEGDENFSDFVARELDISDRQAEVLLGAPSTTDIVLTKLSRSPASIGELRNRICLLKSPVRLEMRWVGSLDEDDYAVRLGSGKGEICRAQISTLRGQKR